MCFGCMQSIIFYLIGQSEKKREKVMLSSGQNPVCGLPVEGLCQEIQAERTTPGCSSNFSFENLD